MIIAAVANIAGGLLGMAPDLLKEWKAGREHGRELETMTRMAEIQRDTAKATADSKMREVEGSIIRDELAATKESLIKIIEAAAKPTGIVWIDALNALLRPVATMLLLILFFWVAGTYSFAVISKYYEGAIPAEQMMTLIFGGMLGDVFQGVFGFLYGYRSTFKR